MQCALGLDLGTTSISAVAVSPEGNLLASRTISNPGHREGLPAGYAEQEPTAILTASIQLLKELLEVVPANPVCLGLTGQMHGGFLIDRHRKPLTPLISWQDRRANEPLSGQLRSAREEFLFRCSHTAIHDSGCTPSAGYLGVTLSWLQQRGEIPAPAERATLLADWIGAELTDSEVVIDRTNAASTGLYDVRKEAWGDELTSAAGIQSSLLPVIRQSGSVCGLVSPETARETGLAAGLPICVALGDNQAAVLGSVPADFPAIQINVGTGGQINWAVEEFRRVNGMDTRPLPVGRYMLVGAGLAGGDSFAWVRKTVQSWIAAVGVPQDVEAVYEKISELAEASPTDCGGLACEPLFRGTRQRPAARGELTGITPENFTIGNVARAVLQGIARGMWSFYESAGPSQPRELLRIIGSGNGLRKNPLLVRTLASTFLRDVWMPRHQEEAAFGAALLAGCGVGLWSDLHQAGKAIQLQKAAGMNEIPTSKG